MLRWFVRAAVSGVVVAILLAFIPVGAVVESLRRISVRTWAAAVLVFFAGHYLNALKLRILIGGSSIPNLTSTCVRAQYAGLVANLSLPGLAGGDLVRAAYLAPVVGLQRIVFASLTDRIIDTMTVVALIVIALPIAGIPPALVPVIERAGMWLAVGAIVALLLGAIATRLSRFAKLTAKVRDALSSLAGRPGAVAGAVALSFVVQAGFVMTNVWLAQQVGVTTALAAWFVAWPLSKLIAILPISLGGIGVREAALVSLLAPYGAPREAVLASGILWQAVLIVTGLAGLLVTQLLPRAPAPATVPSIKDV